MLLEPDVWTGKANACALEPMRKKQAEIHRGSRRRCIGPLTEAGYTSAIVFPEPDRTRSLQSGGVHIRPHMTAPTQDMFLLNFRSGNACARFPKRLASPGHTSSSCAIARSVRIGQSGRWSPLQASTRWASVARISVSSAILRSIRWRCSSAICFTSALARSVSS